MPINLSKFKSSLKNYHDESEWSISHLLGKGALSEGVYLAKKLNGWINDIKLPDDGLCAIKIIGKKDIINNIAKREIEIIDKLMKIKNEKKSFGSFFSGYTNKNIIKFYGYGYDYDYTYGNESSDGIGKLYIYMEYLNGYKSVSQVLKEVERSFNEDEIKYILCNLIQAIGYLHENNIIHRDIKCENILLNTSNGEFRLIDFGISKIIDNDDQDGSIIIGRNRSNSVGCIGINNSLSNIISSNRLNQTIAGTPSHMSPEAKSLEEQLNTQSDIWSLGCTVLEMCGVDLSNRDSKTGNIIISNNLPNELCNFIQSCLIRDPNQRLNIKNIIQKNFYGKSNILEFINSQNSILKDDYFKKDTIFNNISNNNGFLRSGKKEKLCKAKSRSLTSEKYFNLSSYNEPITEGLISSSVTSLSMQLFNQVIEPNSIPSSVRILILSSFNKPLKFESIPNSVDLLILSAYNIQLEANIIPKSVKELKLLSYNQPLVQKVIPNSIKELSLPAFNQELIPESLPSSIKTLKLSVFNQPLKINSIPSSVKSLKLESYNQFIPPYSIPDSVKTLKLLAFNQPLTPNSIPPLVKTLLLPSFNQVIDSSSIPTSITALTLRSFNQPLLPNTIPSSVQYLNLESFNHPLKPNAIPLSVTSLSLSSYNHDLEEDSIPSTVSVLAFGESFDLIKYGGNLSETILNFKCGYHFKKPLRKNNNLPKKVSILELANYNQDITSSCIPSTTHTLTLGSALKEKNLESFSNLPVSIINLTFGLSDDISDDKIKIYIPKTITKIKIINQNNNK